MIREIVESDRPGFQLVVHRISGGACLICLIAAFAVAIPAGLLVVQFTGSLLLLTAVVTLVGTGVSIASPSPVRAK
jgi:hypothetical protein